MCLCICERVKPVLPSLQPHPPNSDQACLGLGDDSNGGQDLQCGIGVSERLRLLVKERHAV